MLANFPDHRFIVPGKQQKTRDNKKIPPTRTEQKKIANEHNAEHAAYKRNNPPSAVDGSR